MTSCRAPACRNCSAANAEYDAYVAALVGAGAMPDASHLWWAIRPSLGNTRRSSCARPIAAPASTTRSPSRRFTAPWPAICMPIPAQCRAQCGRPRDRGREQMARPALRRAGHVRDPIGRPSPSARCSTGPWTLLPPTPTRWGAARKWSTAAPSWPRAHRQTLNCEFLPKMNTKAPRLRYIGRGVDSGRHVGGVTA